MSIAAKQRGYAELQILALVLQRLNHMLYFDP